MAKSASRNTARTSPAIMVAGVGAAVCLSSTAVEAASDKAGVDIPAGEKRAELGGKVSFSNYNGAFLLGTNAAFVVGSVILGYLKMFDTGVKCSTVTASEGFRSSLKLVDSSSGYIKIKFNDAGSTKYGWSYFSRNGTIFEFGAWSYSDTGSPINTLGESVKTSRLDLAGGKAMLHWTNGYEEGVATYSIEVERNGAWEAVASFAPGDGRYSIEASAAAAYRLVTEGVDGATDLLGF